jgi:hypothetical protein
MFLEKDMVGGWMGARGRVHAVGRRGVREGKGREDVRL